jgi:hypothetical protein
MEVYGTVGFWAAGIVLAGWLFANADRVVLWLSRGKNVKPRTVRNTKIKAALLVAS